MSKTISGTTTQFLYDGLNPVQELNSSNGVVANLLTGLRIDEYFTRTASSTTSTLLADALGSAIDLVTANNGSIATSYSYQPFGATTVGGSANGNSFQFTGRENDGTGLYFYRARYYSPTFQRFIAEDPLDLGGGDPNLYGYAVNSPTNLRDPTGKILPLLIAGGVFGGGAAAYSNYGAYENGAITGGQYAEAIAFGAATGVLTAIPTGIIGSALAGTLGAGANSLFDQRLSNPCGSLNLGAAGQSAALGGITGFLAAGLGNLGAQIISENPVIGQEVPEPAFQSGYPTPGYTSYGTPAGIAGGAIGTGVGILYGP